MPTSDERVDLHFPKAQKLCGEKAIGLLFAKGEAFSKYPFRVVYLPLPELREGEAAVRMLVSVGKKRFKRAVKRNRVKRQTREAWRKAKHAVEQAVGASDKFRGLHVAFIFCGDGLPKTADVERSVAKVAARLASAITAPAQ